MYKTECFSIWQYCYIGFVIGWVVTSSYITPWGDKLVGAILGSAVLYTIVVKIGII